MFVARLDANGNLDQTFGGGGTGIVPVPVGQVSAGLSVGVDPSGRILIGGWSFSANATFPAIARLSAEGTLDGTFGTGGVLSPIGTNPDGQTAGINDLVVDGLGRITVAGGSGRFAYLARLVGDGALDPGFAAGGLRYTAIDESAALSGLALDGGRILVSGLAGPGRGPADRLLGILDDAGTPDAGLGGTPPGWRRFPCPAPRGSPMTSPRARPAPSTRRARTAGRRTSRATCRTPPPLPRSPPRRERSSARPHVRRERVQRSRGRGAAVRVRLRRRRRVRARRRHEPARGAQLPQRGRPQRRRPRDRPARGRRRRDPQRERRRARRSRAAPRARQAGRRAARSAARSASGCRGSGASSRSRGSPRSRTGPRSTRARGACC